MRTTASALAFLCVLSSAVLHPSTPGFQAGGAAKAWISYPDARSILEVFRENLPAPLQGRTPAELEALWPTWVLKHDASIRARLERGDLDSIVNLWLLGTSFTKLPRATEQGMAQARGASLAEIVHGRLEDLLTALQSPGSNERLWFARRVLERRGIDPTTGVGWDRARGLLEDAKARAIAEFDSAHRTLASEAAKVRGDQPTPALLRVLATIFRDRGLSSDTSILVDFAIEQSLEAAAREGTLRPGSVRRVAIVGPGLDFINKNHGYDFYPEQTIQPFAVFDSLVRLGLAAPGDLRVTTFDLSLRVNGHLESARERARAGGAYLLHLPLPFSPDERWEPTLVSYWERLGSSLDGNPGTVRPPDVQGVRLRTIRVHPPVVESIVPQDLNVVLERLTLPVEERFDLLIATNVLVYYDTLEQALAAANVAAMLRPGGVFLSNNLLPTGSLQRPIRYLKVVYSNRQDEFMFRYQREDIERLWPPGIERQPVR